MLLNFLPNVSVSSGRHRLSLMVLVGPRTDGKILGGEISTCLMGVIPARLECCRKTGTTEQRNLYRSSAINVSGRLYDYMYTGHWGFDVAFHLMKSMKVKFKLSEIACRNDCSCQESLLRSEGFARAGDRKEGKCTLSRLQVPATSCIAVHQVHVWPKGPNSSLKVGSWVSFLKASIACFEQWTVDATFDLTQLTTGQVALKRIWVTWTDCREAKSCGLVPNFQWNIFTVATQGTWISLWIFSINDQSVNHWSHVSLKELLCHFPIWRVSSAILVLRQRFPEEVEQGYLGSRALWVQSVFLSKLHGTAECIQVNPNI